jgi:DNA-binding MarR family transcriptional regulator
MTPGYRASAAIDAILRLLSPGAPLTGKQIREGTGLPRRTVYEALRRLDEQGAIQERRSLRDTRQTYYWLAPAPGSAP